MSVKTFAIITPVYLEQNYINFFIEYHIALGFNKIYVIIDDSTNSQAEYKIFDELLPFVRLFRHSDFYTNHETEEYLKICYHKSALVHRTIIDKVYPLVSEEYVILLGIDSFLYLENMKLLEYFKNKNISDDTALICFMWTCVHNYSYKSDYNILKSINDEKTLLENNHHFFTLGKKSLVVGPSFDSHYCRISENRKLNFNGNVIEVTPNDNFHTVNPKLLTFKFEKGDTCIIHVVQRDFQDSLVKGLYSWSKEKIQNNLSEITESIIKKKICPGRWRKYQGFQPKQFYDIKYKPSDCTNTKYIFNEDLFNKTIKNSRTSTQEIEEWILEFTNKN